MIRRNVETIIENGRELVRTSLNASSSNIVELWSDDYDYLINTLKLNPNWVSVSRSKPNVLAPSIIDSKISVARVLLDADQGQVVRYKDGNPLNLRRQNLLLMSGDGRGGKRRDRDYIRSSMSIHERPHAQ